MKRKNLIPVLIVISLIIALPYLLLNYNDKMQGQEIPTANPYHTSEPNSTSQGGSNNPGEAFVIPEVALGILGSISALAIALGIFTLTKKKYN